jgi:hypothetical protein
MAARSRIRVEFFFDPEFELWHYAVDEPDLPGINGALCRLSMGPGSTLLK